MPWRVAPRAFSAICAWRTRHGDVLNGPHRAPALKAHVVDIDGALDGEAGLGASCRGYDHITHQHRRHEELEWRLARAHFQVNDLETTAKDLLGRGERVEPLRLHVALAGGRGRQLVNGDALPFDEYCHLVAALTTA